MFLDILPELLSQKPFANLFIQFKPQKCKKHEDFFSLISSIDHSSENPNNGPYTKTRKYPVQIGSRKPISIFLCVCLPVSLISVTISGKMLPTLRISDAENDIFYGRDFISSARSPHWIDLFFVHHFIRRAFQTRYVFLCPAQRL